MKNYYLLFFLISCIHTAYARSDTGRVETSILFGTSIYLYPTYRHVYPYFPTSIAATSVLNNIILGDKDSAMLYKNALNGMGRPVMSVEFNISKNSKHKHGFGFSYGLFRTWKGPSFDDNLRIREFLFYYPYYYCPFRI